MNLYLDSTNNLKVILRLDEREFVSQYATPQDQDVLGFLMQSLKEVDLTLADVTQIEVNPGPGSFTGTRVGVTIANALALALNLPVNGQKPPVLPIYSQPPNISQPRKKS